jgi:ribosomal-protein-serine acetyltransferase
VRFAVRLRHHAELIGVVSLENCSQEHRSCDLGYWLHPTQQGNGLMTEAAQCVLGFAFQEMHAHRIRCAAAEDNIASQNVIARLGFKHEGIAREAEFVAGRWVTHIVYSLLEHEFASNDRDE